jgi:hypothetical protein
MVPDDIIGILSVGKSDYAHVNNDDILMIEWKDHTFSAGSLRQIQQTGVTHLEKRNAFRLIHDGCRHLWWPDSLLSVQAMLRDNNVVHGSECEVINTDIIIRLYNIIDTVDTVDTADNISVLKSISRLIPQMGLDCGISTNCLSRLLQYFRLID